MSEPKEPSFYLEPLIKKRKKRNYLVIDIETKDGDSQRAGFTRPFLAGFFDGEEYHQFRGSNCLLNLTALILQKKYSDWYIYAHNGGGFDFLHMLPAVLQAQEALGCEIEIIPVASTIQSLRLTRGRLRWTFLDSYKLIPLGLAKACESFGTPLKLADHNLDTPEDDPSWGVYLRQDCVSLYRVLERYHAIVEGELGGEVGVTAASTAMRTYRRAYMPCPIERHAEEHEFIRRGYYGGNTQAFVKEACALHYYDINSSYPQAMLGKVPKAWVATEEGKPSTQLRDNCLGFCDVTIEMPTDVMHPCLPYRNEKEKKLIFPVGRFRGVWSSEELGYACERQGARVATWHRSVWYEGANLLANYVRRLYEYRDKSRLDYDNGIALVAKLLMNSLYGKFGQKTMRERIVVLSPGEPIPVGARPASKDPDCLVWYIEEDSDADYIIPQIAATITSRARLQLQHWIDLASELGGLVAYCDTDSVFTTANLVPYCSTALGGLKDEGEGTTFHGHFLQPKLYRMRNELTGECKVAMKGFRRPDSELFERVRSGETIVKSELEKLGSLARAGFTRGPLMRDAKKRMVSSDSKRVWLKDGTSIPITIIT